MKGKLIILNLRIIINITIYCGGENIFKCIVNAGLKSMKENLTKHLWEL